MRVVRTEIVDITLSDSYGRVFPSSNLQNSEYLADLAIVSEEVAYLLEQGFQMTYESEVGTSRHSFQLQKARIVYIQAKKDK